MAPALKNVMKQVLKISDAVIVSMDVIATTDATADAVTAANPNRLI